MDSLVVGVKSAASAFFDFKAYVLLPALMPILALAAPGRHHRVLPLGDLPNLISIMSLCTLVMEGNVLRSVLAGIPVIAVLLLIASDMASLYTSQAAAAGLSPDLGGREITAFTDGGNPLRYWLYWLFQGNAAAWAGVPLVPALLWFAGRESRKTAGLEPPA